MNKKFLFALVALSLVAFFVWKIQPSTSPQTMVELTQQSGSEMPQRPSISYLTILENPEFRSKMQQAVRNGDKALALSLQAKALEIAHAAELSQDQIDILAGDSGLQFMQFLASRQLFNQEFEQFYLQLTPSEKLNDLFRRYPEAQDLFDRAQQMIDNRDEQILSIAEEINQGEPIEQSLAEARQMWQDKVQQQNSAAQEPNH